MYKYLFVLTIVVIVIVSIWLLMTYQRENARFIVYANPGKIAAANAAAANAAADAAAKAAADAAAAKAAADAAAAKAAAKAAADAAAAQAAAAQAAADAAASQAIQISVRLTTNKRCPVETDEINGVCYAPCPVGIPGTNKLKLECVSGTRVSRMKACPPGTDEIDGTCYTACNTGVAGIGSNNTLKTMCYACSGNYRFNPTIGKCIT